jgi:hypothetical protein
MIAKTGSAHCKYAGLLPIEPSDDFFRPTDLKPEPIDLKPEPIDLKPEPIDLTPEDVPSPNWQRSARKHPRAPARFLIAFCTGAATMLLWQSYGGAAKEMIANLYIQLDWPVPRPTLSAQNRHTPDAITPAAPSAEQLNATSIDLDVVGQSVDKSATTIAADQEPTTRGTDQIATNQEPTTPSIGQVAQEPTTPSIGQIAQEPTTPSADQIATSQELTTRSADQTTAAKVTRIKVQSGAHGASSQPTERFDRKPTEARPPQTLSERGKQLSATSGHDASCFPSASAVLHNHPGGWPTWTMRAPGHEGTMCWYAAAGPRGSDHRPRASGHRTEMMRSEEIRSEEIIGTPENRLSAPPAPYTRPPE